MVSLLVTGQSMTPFLLHERSIVFLRHISDRPMRGGDVILFERPDGAVVLHRILRIASDGTMTVGGDAQDWVETVLPAQILAVVVGIARNGSERPVVSVDKVGYRLLVWLWARGRWWHPRAAGLYRKWKRMTVSVPVPVSAAATEKQEHRKKRIKKE